MLSPRLVLCPTLPTTHSILVSAAAHRSAAEWLCPRDCRWDHRLLKPASSGMSRPRAAHLELEKQHRGRQACVLSQLTQRAAPVLCPLPSLQSLNPSHFLMQAQEANLPGLRNPLPSSQLGQFPQLPTGFEKTGLGSTDGPHCTEGQAEAWSPRNACPGILNILQIKVGWEHRCPSPYLHPGSIIQSQNLPPLQMTQLGRTQAGVEGALSKPGDLWVPMKAVRKKFPRVQVMESFNKQLLGVV